MFLVICMLVTLISEGMGLYLGTFTNILVSLTRKLIKNQTIKLNHLIFSSFLFSARIILGFALHCLPFSLQRMPRFIPTNVYIFIFFIIFLIWPLGV